MNLCLILLSIINDFYREGQDLIVNHHMHGVAASAGIVIAKAHHLKTPQFSIRKEEVTDVSHEIDRFEEALDISKQEVRQLREKTRMQLGDEDAEIFSAHLLMLEDPELIDQVKKKIILEHINAESALSEIQSMVMNIFKNMDNFYMRERGADFKDVMNRVMAHLSGTNFHESYSIDEEVVIIADDLLPSDTAKLDRNYIKGFVTSVGGATSHSAIIARSLEIPAVTGVESEINHVRQDDLVIVDGNAGVVVVNPTDEEIEHYQEKKERFQRQKKSWLVLKDKPTVTKDDHKIELAANISTPDEIEIVKQNGGQGIGLYRTEFLYMDQNELPTEEEQFKLYKYVLQQMEGKPVTIRTLDIGGDKEIDYLNLPGEQNPFLGVRAIRFSLSNEEIFRPQLRALLRASQYGYLRIMFPMIATINELQKAKAILQEEKEQLLRDGIEVAENIEIGIMIEVPSTAIMAHRFAKKVDFFSIGTNDLVQYTMAADRMNEHLSYLYQPYHPAILHLIHHVIEAAQAEGKHVSMCGEMAGDPNAVPILLALGLKQLSMSVASILPVRAQIKKLHRKNLKTYKEQILAMDTAEEVLQLLDDIL